MHLSTILWSKKFGSTKWRTSLDHEIKGKPHNFEAYLCGSKHSCLKTSFQQHSIHNQHFLSNIFKSPNPRQHGPLKT